MVPEYVTEALVLSFGANMLFNTIEYYAMESAERSQYQILCQYVPSADM